MVGCLLLWGHFQQPPNLPAEGSWGSRLLALFGSVPHEDPALIQRVRVTRIAVLSTLACLAVLGFLERARVGAALRRYFTTASHPINLAIFRIVVFYQAYALGYFDFIATIVAQPDAMQAPPATGIPAVGPLAALSHWPIHPLGPAEVVFLGQVMKAACITAMLGLFTRASSLVVAFTFFFGWGAMQWYGKVDHHHHILWFILVLSASRCGDALSVDSLVRAWRRGRRGEVEPPRAGIRYGLPIRVCILLLGVLYFFPGFWKIWRSGFDWFLSDSPFNQMYLKWFMIGGWLPSIRPDAFPLLVHASALGTILFELSFILLIFGRRTFVLVGALGVTFHTALDVFMQYGFESLRNSYVAFVNWHRGLVWAGRRLFRHELRVRFDCRDRRTAPLVGCARTLDWLDAVTWEDRAPSNTRAAAPAGEALDPVPVRGLTVHVGGRTWAGAAAWRRILGRLPLLWPLILPLRLLPERWLPGGRRAERGPAPARQAAGGAAFAQGGIVGPLLIGAGLFVGNAWAGLNRMQEGWPLACYPLFDGLIDDSYLALRLVAVDARGTPRVIVPDDYRDVLGRNWNELLRRILDEADESRRRELLGAAWEVLENEEPSLGQARIVRFYTVRSSIVPELWHAPPTDPHLILTTER